MLRIRMAAGNNKHYFIMLARRIASTEQSFFFFCILGSSSRDPVYCMHLDFPPPGAETCLFFPTRAGGNDASMTHFLFTVVCRAACGIKKATEGKRFSLSSVLIMMSREVVIKQ